MWTSNTRKRCDVCGKIMTFHEKAFTWAEYGGYGDDEPPDDSHAHTKCFLNLTQQQINTIYGISWQKPIII